MIALSSKKLSEYKYGLHMDSYLTYAIRFNYKEAVEYLLRREDMSPLCTNENSKNALHFAVECENMEMLAYLCEGLWRFGPATNPAENFSPEVHKEPQYKRWILESWKALDNATIAEGYRPFHQAVITGSKEILKYLVNIIEMRDLQRKIAGLPVEFMSLQDMLENRANGGMTPILLAAQFNKLDTFEYLLSLKANLHVINTKLQNPLHFAVINRNPDMIRLILRRCEAEPELDVPSLKSQIDYRGKTPVAYDRKNELHLALTTIWEAIAKHALQDIQPIVNFGKARYGENVLAAVRAQDGASPLHCAVEFGFSDITRLLVELDADINAKNKAGKTPLETLSTCEAAKKDEETRSLLEQALTVSPSKKIMIAKMQQSLSSSKTLKRVHHKAEGDAASGSGSPVFPLRKSGTHA